MQKCSSVKCERGVSFSAGCIMRRVQQPLLNQRHAQYEWEAYNVSYFYYIICLCRPTSTQAPYLNGHCVHNWGKKDFSWVWRPVGLYPVSTAVRWSVRIRRPSGCRLCVEMGYSSPPCFRLFASFYQVYSRTSAMQAFSRTRDMHPLVRLCRRAERFAFPEKSSSPPLPHKLRRDLGPAALTMGLT